MRLSLVQLMIPPEQGVIIPPEVASDSDPFREKVTHHCAIAGVYGPGHDVVGILRGLLGHMNHRGQEGSMMAVLRPNGSYDKRGGAGWVSEAFSDEDIITLQSFRSSIGSGQNRYSTSGDEKIDVHQPMVVGYGTFQEKLLCKYLSPVLYERLRKEPITLSHNGNLVNAMTLHRELSSEIRVLARNDTGDVYLHLLLSPYERLEDRLRSVFARCEGAFNFIVTSNSKVYGYRDPWGFHPLSIGRLPAKPGHPAGYVLTSETCPYRNLDITFVRDVEPGEGVMIDGTGVHTFFRDERTRYVQLARCVFEIVYFSAPDSTVFGQSVSTVRRKLGAVLARRDAEKGFLPEVIVPMQFSGVTYAEGYAGEMLRQLMRSPSLFGIDPNDTERLENATVSLQTQTGLIVNPHAAGRSFIAPGERHIINSGKHRADEAVVGGKIVVRIDDSTVRGDAAKTGIRRLKDAGACEVHDRIFYPPVRNPCFMGVDFADPRELIVNLVGEDGIAEAVGADSVMFVSVADLIETVTGEKIPQPSPEDSIIFRQAGYCGACITKKRQYPFSVTGVFGKDK